MQPAIEREAMHSEAMHSEQHPRYPNLAVGLSVSVREFQRIVNTM